MQTSMAWHGTAWAWHGMAWPTAIGQARRLQRVGTAVRTRKVARSGACAMSVHGACMGYGVWCMGLWGAGLWGMVLTVRFARTMSCSVTVLGKMIVDVYFVCSGL